MAMCLKDPASLLSMRMSECAFQVVAAVLHCDDSLVIEMNEERVVIGDTQSHQLLRSNEEDLSGIQHGQVLDMKEKGERWEGDVLNNQPYGWGVLYDSENRKMYEGFRIRGVNVCYGTRYYSDIQKVEYE